MVFVIFIIAVVFLRLYVEAGMAVIMAAMVAMVMMTITATAIVVVTIMMMMQAMPLTVMLMVDVILIFPVQLLWLLCGFQGVPEQP